MIPPVQYGTIQHVDLNKSISDKKSAKKDLRSFTRKSCAAYYSGIAAIGTGVGLAVKKSAKAADVFGQFANVCKAVLNSVSIGDKSILSLLKQDSILMRLHKTLPTPAKAGIAGAVAAMLTFGPHVVNFMNTKSSQIEASHEGK